MSCVTRNRQETLAVGILLVTLALSYRYLSIPWNWEALLQDAATLWGLPVADVGRWFSAWTVGDGQVFAVIASDPFGSDRGWQLGYPTYRYSRAGFGWLTWLLVGGQEAWIPYGMFLVGAFSLLIAFLLACRLRPVFGPRIWLIVLNPAVLIAFAGDTAEALGVLALAWTLATGHRWASVAIAVIRPSFLIALAGRWYLFLVGVATAIVFGLFWVGRFGFDLAQYEGGLGVPFLGYIQRPSLQSIGLSLLALGTIIVGWKYRNWAWIASGTFVLCFSWAVVESLANGWRAAGMMFTLWAFGPHYRPARTPSAADSELPTGASNT